MGKNNGKHGAKTPYARWISIMRKLDNELGADKKKAKLSKETEG